MSNPNEYTVLRPSRSEFVPIRNQRYHLRLWGQPGAQPPLVLVHGWMDVAASWQFMIDALSQDFLAQRLIIAPDWRGFGHTTGPDCDHYVFADYLGDLDAIIDHYSPDASVDLLGHSMGGNVVMMYAGARPARIRRLVNLEGFGLPTTESTQAPERYAQWLDEIKALARGEIRLPRYDGLAGVAARLMKTNHRLPPDKAHWLARHWAQARTDAQGQTHWHLLGEAAHRVINSQLFRVPELLALYAAINAPTLMVEAGDSTMEEFWKRRFTLDEFHQRLQQVPDVRRHVLPDCGHMLHHDQPQALARLLEDFVAH